MNKIEKTIFVMSTIFRVVIILAIVIAILEMQWITLFVSILIFLLTFLPAMIERNYKITLPLEFEFLIIFFIFGTLFLGEVGDYYEKYWWWDTMLHALSGIIFGIIGFLFVYVLNRENKIDLHLSAIYVSVFAFAFSLSIGALWEIFEFGMDAFFGLNMQKSGLVDTMWDLIIDSLGALLVAIGGYFYVKKVKTPIFYNLIEKFVNNKK